MNLNLGFQFNSQWNKTAVAGLFISLIQAQEQAVDTMFSRHFFGNDITKASSCGGGGGGAGGVTFSQMSGLFIIVGAVTATCLTAGLISALHCILSIMRQSEEEELERSQSSQTVGRLDDASSTGKCLEHGSSPLSWQPVRNFSTRSTAMRRVSMAFSKVFVSNYDNGRGSLRSLIELNAVGRLSGHHDRFKNTSSGSSSYNNATMMTRETLGNDISDGMSDPQGMLK
ncbi:hypothetical protein CEUSTIGMA_g7058.t1 [Chlamydomonas eustigma]|uniref:Uncharacterized protein n=1 Tax=Chlamydomonas eustigma TaxID=1157962 RepID=A0A250X979_9CHLO|nr:hypothetical protein CEUSTIGMA_g7058.t1 [Chlamydomonas eustigma]|eukprot:GAX79617.1 hypothetical protein CEUSTIGMA_g7058.t1 [Chlamydomonas eustigma]